MGCVDNVSQLSFSRIYWNLTDSESKAIYLLYKYASCVFLCDQFIGLFSFSNLTDTPPGANNQNQTSVACRLLQKNIFFMNETCNETTRRSFLSYSCRQSIWERYLEKAMMIMNAYMKRGLHRISLIVPTSLKTFVKGFGTEWNFTVHWRTPHHVEHLSLPITKYYTTRESARTDEQKGPSNPKNQILV